MPDPEEKKRRILGGVVYVIALLFLGAMIAWGADNAHGHERSDYAECVITAALPEGMATQKHTETVLAYCANLKEEHKDG